MNYDASLIPVGISQQGCVAREPAVARSQHTTYIPTQDGSQGFLLLEINGFHNLKKYEKRRLICQLSSTLGHLQSSQVLRFFYFDCGAEHFAQRGTLGLVKGQIMVVSKLPDRCCLSILEELTR